MSSGPSSTHFPDVFSLLDEFRNTMSDELPDVLTSLRDIQHVIDLVLVLGPQLSNLPYYRMNPVEKKS